MENVLDKQDINDFHLEMVENVRQTLTKLDALAIKEH